METAREKIENLAREYRALYKSEKWESEDIEEFGENEFFGGKLEAFEEVLEILKNF